MDPQTPDVPPEGSTAALLLNRPSADAGSPSAAPVPSGESPAPVLFGLRLLLISYAVSFVASTIGGAVHAYMMERLIVDRDVSSGHSMALATLSGVFYLVHLAAGVMLLLALDRFGRSPAEARVRSLARVSFSVLLVTFLMGLFSYGSTRFLATRMSTLEFTSLLTLISYIDTGLHFAGTVMLIEILLRLRRWASLGDPAVAESEGFVRGGLIGALVARTLVTNISHFVGPFLVAVFRLGQPGSQWPGYFMRLPLIIVFCAAMLWLVQVTAKALASMPTTSMGAQAGAPTAARALGAETAASGYRNLIIGAIIAGVGLSLTLVTYANASALGGRYVIAYGAIVAGVIQFLRGLIQVLKN